MLRRGLPSHVEALTQLAQRLSVLFAKKIEQQSAGRVTQRLENLVRVV